MEFFVYCRDRPGAEELHRELSERHWSFMDGYADGMIARGPTFTDDEADDHRQPAHRRPARPRGGAGVRLRGAQLPGRRVRGGAHPPLAQHAGPHDVGLRRERPSALPDHRARPGRGGRARTRRSTPALIAYGPLLSDDGSAWLGTAGLVEMPDRAAAEAVLAGGPYERVEVHTWFFGGRPGASRSRVDSSGLGVLISPGHVRNKEPPCSTRRVTTGSASACGRSDGRLATPSATPPARRSTRWRRCTGSRSWARTA